MSGTYSIGRQVEDEVHLGVCGVLLFLLAGAWSLLSRRLNAAPELEFEEALRQVNTRVELALRGSDIGVWESEYPDGTFESARVVFTNAWEQLGYKKPESTPGFAAPSQPLSIPTSRCSWRRSSSICSVQARSAASPSRWA